MKKNKVCHISYHNALDDRIYWKELIALKEAGYEAVHICVSDKNSVYTTEEGITVIEVKRQRVIAQVWINRIVQLFIKKKGITEQLLQKAVQVAADIYHYHDLQINVIAKDLKSLAHKPKVIYDVHELWWIVVKEQRKKGWLHALKAQVLSIAIKQWEIKKAAYCDYIIATDSYTLAYFNQYLPAIPKEIIYNYSYFIPQEAADTSKKYDFIYTGLLSEGRGITDIIDAASLLALELPTFQILLIGPFENEDFEMKIKKRIQDKKLEKHIQIHLSVPFTEIASYYKASRIGLGLFHNTPKYTTFIPIKLFEYMAFGLPVVFSDHGPSAKIIQESACGSLVPVNNIPAISAAMKTLLTDKELYSKHSKNGQQAVKEKYNWQLEKNKLLRIYEKLLLPL